MQIKEFSKRVGIAPSKIRYYQDRGLAHGKRSEGNNYRNLTQEDALDVYYAQMLRSYRMSVQESVHFRQEDKESVRNWVDVHIEETERFIRMESIRLERLRILQEYFRAIEERHMVIKPIVAPLCYNLFPFEGEGPDAQMQERIELLAENMPYSYVALRIAKESINDGGEPEVSIGIGILKENLELLGYSFEDLEVQLGNVSLGCYFECEDPCHIRREDIQILLDAVHEYTPVLTHDIYGRIFLQYRKDGKLVYCFSLGTEI